MNHQIFISYRRDGGESLAHLLYERLTREGYRVFLDVESLRSGKFNIALYTEIQNCTDFLLLLPPHGLDRCADPEDWVRLEIEHALRCGKNIVPIMMRGFEFPNVLPPSLSALPGYNGVKADLELFDGVILRLKNQLLQSRPKAATRFPLTGDPDFPAWYKDYLFDLRMAPMLPGSGNPGAAARQRQDFFDWEYKLKSVQAGRTPLTPRNPLGEIQCGGHPYTIYDVFLHSNRQKYAYALRSDIPLTQSPQCGFFSVDDRDQLRLLDPSAQEMRDVLLYYACKERMLDLLPYGLREYAANATRRNFSSITPEMLGGGDPKQYLQALLHLYSDAYNPGLTLPTLVTGTLPKSLFRPELRVDVRLNSPQQVSVLVPETLTDYAHAGSLKLPTRQHILVDLVTVMPNSFWLALAYRFADNRLNHVRLHRTPVYFAFLRDAQGRISITDYGADPKAPHLASLMERFALIVAQMETQCGEVFVD